MIHDPYNILCIADLHCGHRVGLTPPKWQQYPDKYIDLRKQLWNFYASKVRLHAPYDLVIVDGDCTDGKGEKSGGTEQLTADRKEQALMATECIMVAECDRTRLTYGTGYHTGTSEDFEKDIVTHLEAAGVDARISAHLFLTVNGKNINVKHKVGSSVIPHGRLTALAREILQNRQWYLEGVQPLADVILRAHVHYVEQIKHDDCLAITLPALQGLGSKYGSRQCSGTVHFGITVLNIPREGDVSWAIEKIEGKIQAEDSEDMTSGVV